MMSFEFIDNAEQEIVSLLDNTIPAEQEIGFLPDNEIVSLPDNEIPAMESIRDLSVLRNFPDTTYSLTHHQVDQMARTWNMKIRCHCQDAQFQILNGGLQMLEHSAFDRKGL